MGTVEEVNLPIQHRIGQTGHLPLSTMAGQFVLLRRPITAAGYYSDLNVWTATRDIRLYACTTLLAFGTGLIAGQCWRCPAIISLPTRVPRALT